VHLFVRDVAVKLVVISGNAAARRRPQAGMRVSIDRRTPRALTRAAET
jgi:hypothetical protein